MSSLALPELIELCLDKNIPFASYRQPGGEIVTVIQTGGEVEPLVEGVELSEQSGFVIAPFLGGGHCVSRNIRPDIVVVGDVVEGQVFVELSAIKSTVCENNCTDSSNYEADCEEYSAQVAAIIETIESGVFDKAVLSRIKVVSGDHRHKLVTTFMKMCAIYPYSMAYIFQVEDQLWLGATPEVLASVQKGVFRTLSLAATRLNTPENKKLAAWGDKELQEQQYVTDYIERILRTCDLKTLKMGPRYVRQAGNLLHLCTDFTCDGEEVDGKMSQILNALHPTPAVCGMDTEAARDFLLDLEKHDRQYYSGYLGPVNIVAGEIAVYVNLRCMRVCSKYAHIFVGGGITADSIAEDEWQETVMKSKTILSVLED